MDKHFKVHIPGSGFTYDFYGKNEQDVRKQVRNWLRVKRLPNGTSVSEADPESERIIRESQDRMREDYRKSGTIEVI